MKEDSKETPSTYCNKCKRPFNPDLNFCYLCGSPLVKLPILHCGKCGKRISKYNDYCPYCGNKIKVDK
jgi:rRNA maturation endonuclease Nob1